MTGSACQILLNLLKAGSHFGEVLVLISKSIVTPMNPFYCTITEANKFSLNKPVDRDVVYYSELKEWYTGNAFRNFSLKYVVDNCIYYKVGNKEHKVPGGNVLVACKQPHVKAYFESSEIVKSICIDIKPETVAEAFTIISAGKDHNFDNYLSKYFQHPEFFEAVCPVNSASAFRTKLNDLVAAIRKGEAGEQVNKEWFLDLLEKIIYHEYGNYLALNGIQSLKVETKKELLTRLIRARQYMDEEFLVIREISEIATQSNLSEFHFFRSFRQAFGITPYQYLLNKRLELARELILKGDLSITQTALHCNFPDIFTFSKAFKRRFGIPPSHLGKPTMH
jgi:AraC family transcriptional regulator